jgi:tetratricopeptide (TPR) repeat protein
MKKLGDLLSQQEKYDMACEIYKKAYEINKNDLEVINMLANLSYAVKNYAHSEFLLKEYLREKPKDLDNIILL